VLAVISSKINRVNCSPFDAAAYSLRNAVERAFRRLKSFRAIETSFDKLFRYSLASICFAAAISFWIRGVETRTQRVSSRTKSISPVWRRRRMRSASRIIFTLAKQASMSSLITT